MIRRVAEGIKKCVREVDVVARYGGEEFLLVLPSTHFAGSVVVADRIWREVSGKPFDFDGQRPETNPPSDPPPRKSWSAVVEEGRRIEAGFATDPKWAEGPREVHVSIGVALYPSRDVRTKDALIRAAESALAQAKREGGNRICVFQQQGYIYTPLGGGRQDPPSSRNERVRPLDSTRPPAPESTEGGRRSS
ncbi:MAG: GGDEF domain-containing protein [Minicystis sp.]